MLSAIIIDDEQDCVDALSELLKSFTTIPVKVIGTASRLDEGIKLINTSQPDVVFLDINMPHASGIDIYKYFTQPKFKVIFVTAYMQYAIDALKNSATGYLLKPINFVELNEALRKVSTEIKAEKQIKKLEEKVTELFAPEIPGKNIVLDTERGFIIENTRNIEYCMADQSYSIIFSNIGNKTVVSKPLKHLEEQFPADQFYRTHKSYLVNIHYIRQYVRSTENYVVLASGERIPVSIRKSGEFEENIRKMLE